MTVALDISWQSCIKTWINENLEQGHSADSIIGTMANEGFEKDAATTAVHTLLLGEIPTSSPYEYDPHPITPDRIIHVGDRAIRVLLRVEKPQLILFDNVLSADECARIIEMAENRLQPSATIDPTTGLFEYVSTRSSESCSFALSENPFIDGIDRRISALMNCPLENGEGLQLVHYSPGGQYVPHRDYHPPYNPGSIPHVTEGGQRTSTLIVYLNDVEEGGETYFPDAGISFSPRKGQAVYFRYFNQLGQLDEATLHAGLPVIAGEKWIINKWMRRYRADS